MARNGEFIRRTARSAHRGRRAVALSSLILGALLASACGGILADGLDLPFSNSPGTSSPDPLFKVMQTGSGGAAYFGIDSGANASSVLVLQGSSGSDSAVLGDELTDATGWTSAGWSGDYAPDGFAHSVGNASVLSRSISGMQSENFYQISFTITGSNNAGIVVPGIGGVDDNLLFANGDYRLGFKAVSADGLTFKPDSNFNGTISNISVRRIVTPLAPVMTMLDSLGNPSLNIRASLGSLNNVFIGLGSGQYVTTGFQNTSIGSQSLASDTTGYANVAIGFQALLNNTTGYGNLAISNSALGSNVSGNANSALGSSALYNNTSGVANTATGYNTLYYNVGGSANTADGYYSLFHNINGSHNTAFGETSAMNNQTGSANTSVGGSSLFGNDDGYNNAAYGYYSLYGNASGWNNVAIGNQAGQGTLNYSNISNNTLLGYQAGMELLTGGDSNVLIGYQAGSNLTTGASNILIGSGTVAPSETGSNQLNIGNLIYGDLGFGEIGIGSSDPQATLDVNGSFKATTVNAGSIVSGGGMSSGTTINAGTGFKYNNSGGTAGQVLRSDGTSFKASTIRESDLPSNVLLTPGSSQIVATNSMGAAIPLTIGSGLIWDGSTLAATGMALPFGATQQSASTLFQIHQMDPVNLAADISSEGVAAMHLSSGDLSSSDTTDATLISENNGSVGRSGSFRNLSSSNQDPALDAWGSDGPGVSAYSDTSQAGHFEIVNENNANPALYATTANSGSTGLALKTDGNAYVSGDLTVTGVFSNPSDSRLKSDVSELRGALEILASIRGVSYKWNENFAKVGGARKIGQRQVGVIAQEVEKVLPEAVTTGSNGYMAVDYTRLIPVMVEGIKELREEKDKENGDLKAQVKELRERAAELEARLKRLERTRAARLE